MTQVTLPVDWMRAEWLAPLSWGARAAWAVLVCHVRDTGNGRGSASSVSGLQFARMYDIPEELAYELLSAAEMAGKLSVGERWTIAEWELYEDTEASRKRRWRTLSESETTYQGQGGHNSKAPAKGGRKGSKNVRDNSQECPGQSANVRDNAQECPGHLENGSNLAGSPSQHPPSTGALLKGPTGQKGSLAVLALLPAEFQTPDLLAACTEYEQLRAARKWGPWKPVTVRSNAKF